MGASLTLQTILQKKVSLPTPPNVLLRLMNAVGNPDAHGDELVKIISTDSALTLEVIRVANSPYYGAVRQIRSIADALLRIGFNEIMSISCAINTKDLFASSNAGWNELNARFWEHALRMAAAARSLSAVLNPRSSEAFFTAGLLHDCGKLILLRAVPNYAQICKNDEVWGDALVVQERAILGTDHADIGQQLLEHWKLPGNLVKLVAEHHRPPQQSSVPSAIGLLALADQIARRVSIPLAGDVEIPAEALADAAVREDMLPGILISYQAEYQKLKTV